LVALFTGAFAQGKSSGAKLGVGLEFGLPVGDFAEGTSIGFGGSGKAEIPLTSDFNFTLTAGYITYYLEKPYRDFFKAIGSDPYLGYVPLKVGGKYYFSRNVYTEAEVGASIGTNNSSGTAFIYAPGLGVSFPVNNMHDVDFGIRYESWSKNGSNIGQVAFRLAYTFGL
jgi:hypothetical protein